MRTVTWSVLYHLSSAQSLVLCCFPHFPCFRVLGGRAGFWCLLSPSFPPTTAPRTWGLQLVSLAAVVCSSRGAGPLNPKVPCRKQQPLSLAGVRGARSEESCPGSDSPALRPGEGWGSICSRACPFVIWKLRFSSTRWALQACHVILEGKQVLKSFPGPPRNQLMERVGKTSRAV